MLKGRVKSWDVDRNFGFIILEGFPEDIFVHHTGIRMTGYRTLVPGEAVEFLIKRDDKGWKAINVVRAEAQELAS